LKVATFAAQLEQYPEAIEKFESVAEANVDNNLTKWSVREYLLKAGLCHLASGVGASDEWRLPWKNWSHAGLISRTWLRRNGLWKSTRAWI
jgi:hypothetical protein